MNMLCNHSHIEIKSFVENALFHLEFGNNYSDKWSISGSRDLAEFCEFLDFLGQLEYRPPLVLGADIDLW
jgi:hypothetical protein